MRLNPEMMKNIPGYLAATAALILLFSCGNMKENVITPPFENVDMPFETFDVNPSEGKTIDLAGGGSLVIPPDVFVDKDGNPIKDVVTIKFREFHNAASIIASGIPMVYDSAGKKMDFQTAGMFDIQGVTGHDEPVYIAPGKNITVNLASDDSARNYNFYEFNEELNNWVYRDVSEPEFNTQRQEIDEKLSKLPPQPLKPQEYVEGVPVFDLQFETKDHPELEAFANIIWQYAGEKGDKNADISLNEWIWKENWNNVLLQNTEKQGVYTLTLTSSGKSFVTTVSPALKGKDLERAMKKFEESIKEYEVVMKEKTDLEMMRQDQWQFIRSASISAFGIYNCDRMFYAANSMAVSGSFAFDEQAGKIPSNASVYLITGKERAVVTLQAGRTGTISWDPNDDNQLVAILPGNRVALFTNQQFKALTGSLSPGSEYTFHLITKNEKIGSMDSFFKALTE